MASVIVKVEAPTKLDSTQFESHLIESSTLQLIKSISNDIQKPVKYFSDSAIFTQFLFVIRLDLYLNDEELFGICWALTVESTFPSIPSF